MSGGVGVSIRVTRPLLFDGERFVAGQVLKASPLDAANLLSSGRAELIDDVDLQAVRSAVRDDVRIALRDAGKSTRELQVAAPWQRLD